MPSVSVMNSSLPRIVYLLAAFNPRKYCCSTSKLPAPQGQSSFAVLAGRLILISFKLAA